ncbi:Rox3-domain-containing protein [Polyplosphaeria fusca]|uniref:Mediator of RNA polymerase II transcription subunit 19 n=1 Tax=Polyplosphaeria fusca TaxID=682080 RepID=A0A9P4R6G2_9PLEO|nr:Rox3-domain-containing protein [Polyplosphaeria fusca]
MSHHTAKRQRLTGSFSPASPPYHLAKPSDQTKDPIVHPNTPTSPPYMSTTSQPNGRAATTASVPTADVTSPSAASMAAHPSQSAASASIPHPFPTPSSTAGVISSSNIDSDGDAAMADDDDTLMSTRHRRSDHNRQDGASGAHLFRLCQNAHERSRPHASQNLFDLYSLNDLAKSVARTDPVTGEKINKLRKSYEGHIKNLQIAGKPKATKIGDHFTMMMAFPAYEYEVQHVKGKEIDGALNQEESALSSDFDSLLSSALEGMGPGALPPKDASLYKTYLGMDEVLKPKVVGDGPPGRLPQSIASTPLSAPQAARTVRPERTGSKRSYNEASFSGYGEGFVDDYPGNSTGGEDDGQGGMSKKRRLAFERTSHQVEVGGVRR